jgi:DNA mismatch repair protein MutH
MANTLVQMITSSVAITTASLTPQVPFSVPDKRASISFIALILEVNLGAIVCPRPEFHFTELVIEREPSNVYFARALEHPRRDVAGVPVVGDHHVHWERAIETFVGTGRNGKKNMSLEE